MEINGQSFLRRPGLTRGCRANDDDDDDSVQYNKDFYLYYAMCNFLHTYQPTIYSCICHQFSPDPWWIIKAVLCFSLTDTKCLQDAQLILSPDHNSNQEYIIYII